MENNQSLELTAEDFKELDAIYERIEESASELRCGVAE